MKPLDPKYAFIDDLVDMPRHMTIARSLYGTLEAAGTRDNPVIIAWADEVGRLLNTPYARWAADWYNKDSIAWCGLYAAYCLALANTENLANRAPPNEYLAALNWATFGVGVDLKDARFGDVMVYTRQGGGHVAFCVGQTKGGKSHFILGGNQNDQVNIVEKKASELAAVRRIPYRVMPAAVKQYELTSTGKFSTNEA